MAEAVPRESERSRIEALLAVQRFDEAARLADQMIARRPDDATAHALRAQARMGQQRYDEALDAADRATALAPDREWCHRLRSVALRKLDRPADAIVAAREAARLAPNLAAAHQTLSHAYRQARQGQAAWDTAMIAVMLDPTDPDSHEAAGMAALELGQMAKAEYAFRTQLEIDPQSTYALNNLGVALERDGRKAEAMELYQRAAQLEPREQLFRRNVGRLAYAQSLYRTVFVVAMVGGFLLAGALGFLIAIVLLVGLYQVQRFRVHRIASDPERSAELGVESAKLEAMKLHLSSRRPGDAPGSRRVWLVRGVFAVVAAALVVAVVREPDLRTPVDNLVDGLLILGAVGVGALLARIVGRR